MKKHLFSAAICLVLLLAAGCENNANITDLYDEISETETAAQITEKTSEIEAETITNGTASEEAVQKSDGEITTVQNAQKQSKHNLPLLIDLNAAAREHEIKYHGNNIFIINDSFLCERNYYSTDSGKTVPALYFYDIDSLSFVKTLDLPDGWIGYNSAMPSDSPDVLVKYRIYRFDEEYNEDYGLMTIFNDYSYEIKEHYKYSDQIRHFSGHDVFLQHDGIYLADDTPKKIVEFQPYEEPHCIYPINGGFVYSIINTGDPSKDFPPIKTYTYSFDSGSEQLETLDDTYIISSNGDRIFSYKMNSFYDTTLYVTDLTTSSTNVLSETEFEADHGNKASYAVTSDGSKILCAVRKSRDGSLLSSVYILDSVSGEILDVHELPEELDFHGGLFNRISFINYDGKEVCAIDGEEKVYLFEI